MEIQFYIILIISGLVGGVIAGLLGIGGGLIFILILPEIFKNLGFPAESMPQYVIANSLFATFLSAMSANIELIRKNEFYYQKTLIVGIASVVTSYVVLKTVVYQPWYSATVFNIFEIALLTAMAFQTIRQNREQMKTGMLPIDSFTFAKNMLTGFFAGIITPLSGLGGGIVMVPTMYSGYKLDIRVAKSISLGAIALSTLGVSIINMANKPNYHPPMWHFGYIVLGVALPLGAGVMFGAPLGVKLSRRIDQKYLAYGFVVFIAITAIRKLLELI